MLVSTATSKEDGSIESDKLLRTVQVTPPGFPVTFSDSNILDSTHKFHTTITIPNDMVPNSLSTSLNLYLYYMYAQYLPLDMLHQLLH